MPENQPRCVYCQASDHQLPLITLTYQGQPYYICPQHLPILIHQPSRLAGKLPGVENLQPGEEEGHHHH